MTTLSPQLSYTEIDTAVSGYDLSLYGGLRFGAPCSSDEALALTNYGLALTQEGGVAGGVAARPQR